MTKKCEDCEKHKNGDCNCKDCPECAVLFDNDGGYHGSVCDNNSGTCKKCKEDYALMKLEEIEEYYKNLIMTYEEFKKRYNHEPFGKTKVFVTTEKAWENLGKLSTSPMDSPEPCPFCGCHDIHTFQPTAYEIGDEASVTCEECGAEVRGKTLKIALRKWNTRVIG